VNSILKPGGKFLILGPNIRYLSSEYWDFYDHHLPLSHLSVAEGLSVNEFNVEKIVDRFLPYTTQTRIPQHPALVAMYLRVPFMWRVMGKQFFLVGRKTQQQTNL
jgi:hypothetical protein